MMALETTPDTGRIIGRWRILGRIGAGGFADVYTALPAETAERVGSEFVVDPATGALVARPDAAFEIDALGRGGEDHAQGGLPLLSPVALKVARPGGEAELRRGARTQASFAHPGIVKVVEHGLDHEPPFLALEWERGGSLREVLTKRGRLAPFEALRVVDRILEILEFTHERGIVHGDIKPENVLVSEGAGPLEARIRLTDFGLRRRIPGTSPEGGSVAGGLDPSIASRSVAIDAGTPAYLAPEAAMGKEGDHRIDVFACGVLLCELATGRRPLGSDLPSDIMPAVLPALDPIVKNATRGDPERRTASATVMRARIREALPAKEERAIERRSPARDYVQRTDSSTTIGDLLSAGASLYGSGKWHLIILSILAHALSLMSFGIFGAPFHFGLHASAADALTGQRARPGDRIAESIAHWIPLLIANYVMAIGIVFGLVCGGVPGIYLAARWIYVTPAIAVDRLSFFAAFRRSADLAHRGGVARHMGLATILWGAHLVLGFVPIPYVGAIVVGPLAAGSVTAGYLRLSRGTAGVAARAGA